MDVLLKVSRACLCVSLVSGNHSNTQVVLFGCWLLRRLCSLPAVPRSVGGLPTASDCETRRCRYFVGGGPSMTSSRCSSGAAFAARSRTATTASARNDDASDSRPRRLPSVRRRRAGPGGAKAPAMGAARRSSGSTIDPAASRWATAGAGEGAGDKGREQRTEGKIKRGVGMSLCQRNKCRTRGRLGGGGGGGDVARRRRGRRCLAQRKENMPTSQRGAGPAMRSSCMFVLSISN